MLTVPDSVLAGFATRETQIGNGEALAPFLCLMADGAALRGASVVWFIDSLGVLSAFCNGASSIADFDCVVHAVLLRCAHLRLSVWWEHVDSAANCSDGGSREGVTCAVAHGLGVKLREVPMCSWPAEPLLAPTDTWLALWGDD